MRLLSVRGHCVLQYTLNYAYSSIEAYLFIIIIQILRCYTYLHFYLWLINSTLVALHYN